MASRRDARDGCTTALAAGIPHYWIVDLDAGPSLLTLTLVDGAYVGEVVTGLVTTTVPFELRIDLTALA